MQFRIWHLLLLVMLTAISCWAFTRIGTNSARYEIVEMDMHHDKQWDKYWSRIEWNIHLPTYEKGDSFTSFIEVDKDFKTAGYKAGDVLRFRFQENKFIGRPKQNPKQVLIGKLFSVEGNILEDNGGDIFAGPFPTVKKEDSDAQWE